MNIVQNSEQMIVFLLVDAADYQTPKEVDDATVLISRNGGTFKKPANSAEAIGGGWYKLVLAAEETAELGPLIVRASATDTVEWRDIHYVVPEPVIEVPDIELPTIEVPTPIVIVRPVVEGSEPSEKDPRLGDNILKNGDFAKGKEGWRVYNEGQPGEATWSVKNGVATLTFPTVSDNMQLYQPDLVTTEGEYQLTFDAKGKDGHTLEVFYHQHERPYLSLGLATGVTLAEKWKTYVIPFTVPETETNGRLRFWFVGHANKGDQFELRSVRLQQILQD